MDGFRWTNFSVGCTSRPKCVQIFKSPALLEVLLKKKEEKQEARQTSIQEKKYLNLKPFKLLKKKKYIKMYLVNLKLGTIITHTKYITFIIK